MNKIIPLSAFKDNYIWAIHSLEETEILVVDPGDANPVLKYLQVNNLTLGGILLTHHHWDHSGGIMTLLKNFPKISVYGSALEKVDGLTHFLQDHDHVPFPAYGLSFETIAIPGHTLGHIAYLGGGALFCGDTLFACGCGRVFEGTPAQMYHSLTKIKQLEKNTQIYCGHEYTLANMIFAQTVDPHNIMLKNCFNSIKADRERNLPSLPSTLDTELAINPFLRCEDQTIIASVQKYCGFQLNTPIEVFTHLREWKNTFS